MMRKIFHIFGIRRQERPIALLMLLVLVALNALVVCKYYDLFTPVQKYYWPLFIHNFHISGFDPITYSVVSDWTEGYNVYRHPLLAFYMYVPYLINQGLIWLTGINCAMFIVATIQVFCGFYSAVFINRILTEVVSLRQREADLLTLFFFSFAFVMLSAMVPDHFIISMMLLLIALWVSGRRMLSGRRFKAWQTVLYFMLTAGTSLNNGLKIFLSSLFVNGRRFFRPKHLIMAVLLPSAVIWGVSRVVYAKMVWPREMAQKKARAEKKARQARIDSIRLAHDSILMAHDGVTTHMAGKRKAPSPLAPPEGKKPKPRVRQGQPISNGEFMRWTDISTSRVESVVENLFGESIQLHKSHLLEDEFRSRPMIVRYTSAANYMVEALVVLLFVVGVWCGRHSRFLWLVMSYFALDMVLHVGLGFGLNEVYIMSAHWIYAIPIATAFIIARSSGRGRRMLCLAIALLTAWLWVYNVTLITKYMIC